MTISIELVTLLMFSCLVLGLAVGIPLAFTLGAVGIAFCLWLWGWEGCYIVYAKTYGYVMQNVLVAVILFVFMGTILQGSGLADALYEMGHRWGGPVRGGLCMGTVVICAIMGAMSGLAAAATISMGLIALPAMLKRGYERKLAVGTIAAGGTLAILIPPSVPMIIYAMMSQLSVGKLFVAGVVPGLLLAGLLIGYIAIIGIRRQETCPALPKAERASWKKKFSSLVVAFPSAFVVVSVLGSVATGAATPTEAAGVGAVAALVAATIYRRFNWHMLKESITRAVRINCFIMWIVVGAAIFGAIYHGLGASEFIKSLVLGQEANPKLVLGIIVLILLFLGMFLDTTAIIIMVTPTFHPLIVALGFNGIHFAIIFVIAAMIGYLTPPFGICLFYMRSVAPPDMTTMDIYRAVFPFIGVLLVGLALIVVFPQICLWLPRLLMGELM